MNTSIVAALNAALSLISAGTEIVEMLKGKEALTPEELQAIIDKQNEQQTQARNALLELLK